MRTALVVLAVFFGALAALAFAVSLYTSHKLERGRMVRGEIPGGEVFVGRVTARRNVAGGASQRSGEHYPDQCELTLEVVADGKAKETRAWATEPECATLFGVGSPATLVRVAGDDELYLRGGTWASPGNGEFDRLLLVAERVIAGGLAFLTLLFVAGAALIRRRA